MTEPTSTDLGVWLARARMAAPDSPEIAPGVSQAEAEAAAAHAIIVQGGYSTPEIEGQRLSEDRAKQRRQTLVETPQSPPRARGPRPTGVWIDEAQAFGLLSEAEWATDDPDQRAVLEAHGMTVHEHSFPINNDDGLPDRCICGASPDMPTDEQFREDDRNAMEDQWS